MFGSFAREKFTSVHDVAALFTDMLPLTSIVHVAPLDIAVPVQLPRNEFATTGGAIPPAKLAVLSIVIQAIAAVALVKRIPPSKEYALTFALDAWVGKVTSPEVASPLIEIIKVGTDVEPELFAVVAAPLNSQTSPTVAFAGTV